MEVDLLVRGRDLDHYGELWTMGDDIEVEAALDEKVEDIVEMILERHQKRFPKGTPKLHASRFDVFVPGKEDHKVRKEDYSLALRRVGLTVRDNVLEIRPTTMGVWLWHPMQYLRGADLDESRRRRGRDADSPRRRCRGCDVDNPRGGGSRRRRGCHVDISWRRVAATSRVVRGDPSRR